MRALLLLALLAPSLAWAAGPSITRVVEGSAVVDAPRCDLAFQLPGLSGGDYVCGVGVSPLTTTRASTCMAYDGSEWTTQPANAACVGVNGLEAAAGFINYWTNSTDPSLWSAIGTPTITGNLIVDDDSAVSEGVRLSAAPSAGAWTAACYLRAGTTGTTTTTARVILQTDGTGSTTCTASGLTEAVQRFACSGTVGGSPTYVQGQVLIGTAGTHTGSVFADQCQLTRTSSVQPRHDCGASACTREGDKHTVSASDWSTAGGEMQLQFTPLYQPTGSVRVLVDTRDMATGNNGWGLYLNSNGQLVLETYAAGVGSTSSAVPTMMALGSTYTLRAPLDGTGDLCVDAVCIPITLPAPGSHATVAAIGSNRNGVNIANGSIRLLRVSE